MRGFSPCKIARDDIKHGIESWRLGSRVFTDEGLQP